MPAQKRSRDTSPPPCAEDDNNNYNISSVKDNNSVKEQSLQNPTDSNGSSSSNVDDEEDQGEDEIITVNSTEICKEVQCPICLGIIRRTRTVMECLHRFCRECIDKSMRLGNNECPACRTHCASRRSLRDDPNYDALIAALYPDIDKYEAEELAFHEEERARNQQIQASIAQTMQRQTEALGRKRSSARGRATSFERTSLANHRNINGRKKMRAGELQGSDADEQVNGHGEDKNSSSDDEQIKEVKPKRYKRWGRAQFSQNSLAATSADVGGVESDSEVKRDKVGASAGLVGSSEIFSWGKGAARTHKRNGNVSAGNGKNARNSRISKLLENFRNSEEEKESDIHLMLVSLDEKRIPSLPLPSIYCRPTLSIRHICEYVTLNIDVHASEVEILLVKDLHSESDHTATSISACTTIDPCKAELHILDGHETLEEVRAMDQFSQQHLLLAYRKKSGSEDLR